MAHRKYYLKDGTVVPSVTTIIGNNLGWNKNILMAWTKKIALTQGRDSDEIVEEAADIGTFTHALVENRIKTKMGIKDELPDISSLSKEFLKKAKNGYMAFCDWEAKWKPDRYVFSELPLVSERHKYAGTIDIIAEKNDKLYIIDIKTSNHLHPEMVVQLMAYKELFHECVSNDHRPDNPFDNRYIEGCSIVKLSKDEPVYNMVPVPKEQWAAGWQIFFSCRSLHDKHKIVQLFGKNI